MVMTLDSFFRGMPSYRRSRRENPSRDNAAAESIQAHRSPKTSERQIENGITMQQRTSTFDDGVEDSDEDEDDER